MVRALKEELPRLVFIRERIFSEGRLREARVWKMGLGREVLSMGGYERERYLDGGGLGLGRFLSRGSE